MPIEIPKSSSKLGNSRDIFSGNISSGPFLTVELFPVVVRRRARRLRGSLKASPRPARCRRHWRHRSASSAPRPCWVRVQRITSSSLRTLAWKLRPERPKATESALSLGLLSPRSCRWRRICRRAGWLRAWIRAGVISRPCSCFGWSALPLMADSAIAGSRVLHGFKSVFVSPYRFVERDLAKAQFSPIGLLERDAVADAGISADQATALGRFDLAAQVGDVGA